MTETEEVSTIVYLGFVEDLKQDEHHVLERHYLPLGKVGGKPAWLNPATVPQPFELTCKVKLYPRKG